MEDKELFQKFEEYFTRRGWTFEQAAEIIHVSRGTLFNWKRGGSISRRGRRAMLALVATIDDHIEAPFIDAPNNNGNVVGVNHAATNGRAEIINLILSSDELSDAEKVKFLKILQK